MLEAQDLAARRGYSQLFAGLSFRVEPGRRWSSPAPTAPARRRCCGCSPGCPRPTDGDIRWDGRQVRPFDPGCAPALAFAGHSPALKDELTAEENLASLVELAGEPVDARGDPRRARRGRARPQAQRCRRACCRRASGGASASRGCAAAGAAVDPGRAGHRARRRRHALLARPGRRAPRRAAASRSPPRTRRSACPRRACAPLALA